VLLTDLAYDLVVDANLRHIGEIIPSMPDLMLPLLGLSPVSGTTVVAKFEGGLLSSDGCILMLREVEQRIHQPIDDLAHVNRQLVAAALGWRD